MSNKTNSFAFFLDSSCKNHSQLNFYYGGHCFVEHTLNYFCIFLNINKIDKCTNAGGTTMKNRQRIEREEPRWFPCHGSVGLGLHGAGWPMYRVTHRECQNYSFCWNWKHSWVYWMFRRLVYASSSSSSTPSGSSSSSSGTKHKTH